MAYTVLARKYRPQTFEDLVGQEHVARTLGNAIASGRVAHAFLFTGVRGVGKTTTARLLAKCLNCEKGPTATPCNECAPCLEITSGRDVDVQEIDGASNNSVEDVRRLQETIPYRPARDRFKIVIVDEVHMLSTGAFNAFLKTLEEPPSHVKFIFATTESHKVPITIRSRCQRYDFRLIPQATIAARVRDILAMEGLDADEGAVGIVAREAAGSMRDALTLLDQLVAFGGGKLEGAEVARTLGIASREHLQGIAAAILQGSGKALLESVHALASQGVDPLHFAKQLLGLLRDLVVLSVTGDTGELVDLVEEERAWALARAREADTLELERCFAQVSRVVEDVARAAAPAMALEMGLLRVATRPPLRPLAELVARLEALEARAPGPGPSTGGGSTGGRGPGRGAGPRSEGGSGARAASAEERSSGPVAAVAPVAMVRPPIAAPEPPRAPTASVVARSPAIAAAIALSEAEPSFERAASSPPRAAELVVAERAPERAPAPPVAEEHGAARSRGLLRPALQEWERVVRHVRDREPAHAAFLEHAVPQRVTAERVVLGFQEGSFYGRKVDTPTMRAAITEAVVALLGGTPEIEVRFDATAGDVSRTVATIEAKRRGAELDRQKRDALNHPVVLDALEVFPEARGKVDVRIEEGRAPATPGVSKDEVNG